MVFSKISDIAIYLPEKVETNEQLAVDFPDWTPNKIEKIVGIKQRHLASEDETSLDLAVKACLKLFENVDKNLVDFVLFCSQNSDYLLPASACILQDRLGLRTDIGAFDYNLGCTGFVFGLATAKGLISAGIASNVLLVTTDIISKKVNKTDRANRLIFGDGAAATLVTTSSTNDVGEFSLGTDGTGYANLIIHNGGAKHSYDISAEDIIEADGSVRNDNYIYMNGLEVFNFTIKAVPGLIDDVLVKNGLKIDDVDYFIFHQANQYMLEYLKSIIKIPDEKFYINMIDIGNTSSSTIPIGIKDALDKGCIKKGYKVLLAGFGVGYSYGAVVVNI
jgi:3-oxoacyl-[acyl-carrier-protein] synthase III